MFCKYCGTKMDDNATVCPSCGKKVEKPASAPGQTGGHGLETMFNRNDGVNKNLSLIHISEPTRH